jgi:hypothetical protein
MILAAATLIMKVYLELEAKVAAKRGLIKVRKFAMVDRPEVSR